MVRQVKRDAVLNRSSKEARVGRETKSREVTQKRELSDEERVEMMRLDNFQSALPDLPKIPGFHTCWLTTTNPRDSIVKRERLGYILLDANDFPEYTAYTHKGDQYSGKIMVNEMIAAKIKNSLYQRYMALNHHEAPLYEEEKLVGSVQQQKEQAASMGSVLIESPGIVGLGQDPGVPDFNAPPRESRRTTQGPPAADDEWVDEGERE